MNHATDMPNDRLGPVSDDARITAAELIAATQALVDERDDLREQLEHLLQSRMCPTCSAPLRQGRPTS
jgi:hypothetical protein